MRGSQSKHWRLNAPPRFHVSPFHLFVLLFYQLPFLLYVNEWINDSDQGLGAVSEYVQTNLHVCVCVWMVVDKGGD